MIAMLILCTMQNINSGMNIITNNLCFFLLGTNTMQTLKTAVRMMHLQPKKEHCNIACPQEIGYNTNGGMGNQCQHFLKHLTHKIAQKDTEPYNTVIAWLRMQISFKLLRLVQACMRGSQTPFHSKKEHSLDCKIPMKGYSQYFKFTLYFNNGGVFQSFLSLLFKFYLGSISLGLITAP